MVAARSAAMGFNRLVDARLDALNPADGESRAAARRHEQQRKPACLSSASARVRRRYLASESGVPGALAGRARDRVLVLARQARHDVDADVSGPGDGRGAGRWLACGRRTWRLGALAAGARDRHMGGRFRRACMRARIIDFDRAHGLRSIPVRFGVPAALVISRAMHVVTIGCLLALALVHAAPRPVYLVGVVVVAALLVYEQSLVRADDLSQVKRAFDMNGYVGILYLVVLIVAIYGH